MIEYIDDIKTKIVSIQRKTDNFLIDEIKINQYLDAILAVRKMVDDTSNSLNNLVEELYSFFKNASQGEYLEIKPSLESLCQAVSKFYIHARNSGFYSGAKASIKEYHSSISGLKELIQDLELFLVKLPDDKEYNKLANGINELFA